MGEFLISLDLTRRNLFSYVNEVDRIGSTVKRFTLLELTISAVTLLLPQCHSGPGIHEWTTSGLGSRLEYL